MKTQNNIINLIINVFIFVFAFGWLRRLNRVFNSAIEEFVKKLMNNKNIYTYLG